MTKNQILFARLIIRSHITWDTHSLQELSRQFQVPGIVDDDFNFYEVISCAHPVICFGCGTDHLGTVTGYPHLLTHCPVCTEQKISPLKYKEQYLNAGEAKIKYIEEAMIFRNDHTRDFLLSRILEPTRTKHATIRDF